MATPRGDKLAGTINFELNKRISSLKLFAPEKRYVFAHHASHGSHDIV